MLKLPRSVDYSILMLLALYEAEPGECLSAPALAQRCDLSPALAAKMLKVLQRRGIIGSIRGPKGGYFLENHGRRLNLVDVYLNVEGPVALSECLSGQPCDCRALPNCRLKPHLQKVNQAIHDALATVTLEKLSQSSKTNDQVSV